MIIFGTEQQSILGADIRDTEALQEDDGWEEITFEHTKNPLESINEQSTVTSEVRTIDGQNIPTAPVTADPQQFN